MSAVLVYRGAGIYEERLAGYGIDALKGVPAKMFSKRNYFLLGLIRLCP